jgi:hypothetical protein
MIYQRTMPQILFDLLFRVRPDVLNMAIPASPVAPSDLPLAVRLKQTINQMKTEALDINTGRMDYSALSQHKIYRDYRALTAELRRFDLTNLDTRGEKLAFWLNLYNALIIDGIIHYGVRESVNEVRGFFRRVAYDVGGVRFCADDIEHGILRANAGHPFIPGAQFGKDDSRRSFALENRDFRIHFALVCGAESCPPVNFYDAEQIDTQLDLATGNFLNQDVEINLARKTVTMSKLLQWYGVDFGAGFWVMAGWGDKRPLLRTIAPFLVDAEQRGFIEDQIEAIRVQFRPYNWALNQL